MWTHSPRACVTRISGNLRAKKMLFDIIRIRSKPPALKALHMKYKIFFKTLAHYLRSNNHVAINVQHQK